MHIIQITTIMGIIITSKNAKYPNGMKIASKIVSYLFEEQYGELECDINDNDFEMLRETERRGFIQIRNKQL